MTVLLNELKTRARLQLNAGRRAHPELRLRQCLVQAARQMGFAHWDHARHVLSGQAVPGDDMGTFWHAPRCSSLLNAWFSDHERARAALTSRPRAVLLPYLRQFVVVNDEFIHELGLDPSQVAWNDAQNDLVQAYGTAPWLILSAQRMRAPLSSFGTG